MRVVQAVIFRVWPGVRVRGSARRMARRPLRISSRWSRGLPARVTLEVVAFAEVVLSSKRARRSEPKRTARVAARPVAVCFWVNLPHAAAPTKGPRSFSPHLRLETHEARCGMAVETGGGDEDAVAGHGPGVVV